MIHIKRNWETLLNTSDFIIIRNEHQWSKFINIWFDPIFMYKIIYFNTLLTIFIFFKWEDLFILKNFIKKFHFIICLFLSIYHVTLISINNFSIYISPLFIDLNIHKRFYLIYLTFKQNRSSGWSLDESVLKKHPLKIMGIARDKERR